MDVPSQEGQSALAGAPGAAGGPRAADRSAEHPAAKAAGAWIHQFARTLKTCRLYHASNPTVVRFREELAVALQRIVEEHGPLTYRFTAEDVLLEDLSLYPARSREDNLALPFYRDGVRAITFNPGITGRELEAVLEALLLTTGQAPLDDDLVTLLWQANLAHVDIDYVPAEGDVGAATAEEAASLMPWPAAAPSEDEAPRRGDAEADTAAGESGSRSDDWTTGDLAVEIEAGFAELESLAAHETVRFRDEFAAEHEISLLTTALAIAHAYLDAGADDGDRAEMARFVPRMLRMAIEAGAWLEAREALTLLRECGSEEWSPESFSQELLQPISVSATVALLDRQEPAQVVEFTALANELGEPGMEWLHLTLAESQQRVTRRVLAEAVAALCRDRPERLAPWLADPRWYVVRNAVHVLGWIGGQAVVGMLETVLRHPDPRVRREVAAALGQVDPGAARPLLTELLSGADTRLFCAILQRLACERHTPTARLLVGYLQAPGFEQRPNDEKRAIYTALAATATDDVLPDLEAELVKGNWLTRGAEAHRQAIARCVARIGTPRARALLERGAESRRPTVRAACAEALRMVHVRG